MSKYVRNVRLSQIEDAACSWHIKADNAMRLMDSYMNYVFHIHDTNDMYNLITNKAIENESL